MVMRVIWRLVWFFPFPWKHADLIQEDAFPVLQVTDKDAQRIKLPLCKM